MTGSILEYGALGFFLGAIILGVFSVKDLNFGGDNWRWFSFGSAAMLVSSGLLIVVDQGLL